MKVEHVNCFVQGTQTTLKSLSGETGALGKLFVKQLPYTSEAVSVIIGIHGDLNAKVIYTMNTDCGIYLASKFMAGFTVDSMNEMAWSAIAEIANMISGNAANALFSIGYKVDITTPTKVAASEGAKFGFFKPGSILLCMPIQISTGQIFEIDLYMAV